MITKLLMDTDSAETGTPIKILGSVPPDKVEIRLPDGEITEVPVNAVDLHEPEESLPALSEALGIPYDTLVRYAREGRVLARKSGGVWLSTVRAVQAAAIKPRR